MLIEDVIRHSKACYNGSPWYGRSLREILFQIDTSAVGKRPLNDGHSIFELTEHILSWRTFLLEKIRGNVAFTINVNDERDWRTRIDVSPEEWNDLLAKLDDNQQKLLTALKEVPQKKMLETVPGKNYTYASIIEGIVQHDIYHAGQIVTTAKLLGAFRD